MSGAMKIRVPPYSYVQQEIHFCRHLLAIGWPGSQKKIVQVKSIPVTDESVPMSLLLSVGLEFGSVRSHVLFPVARKPFSDRCGPLFLLVAVHPHLLAKASDRLRLGGEHGNKDCAITLQTSQPAFVITPPLLTDALMGCLERSEVMSLAMSREAINLKIMRPEMKTTGGCSLELGSEKGGEGEEKEYDSPSNLLPQVQHLKPIRSTSVLEGLSALLARDKMFSRSRRPKHQSADAIFAAGIVFLLSHPSTQPSQTKTTPELEISRDLDYIAFLRFYPPTLLLQIYARRTQGKRINQQHKVSYYRVLKVRKPG
ncbi:hypothetical protein TNCV_4695861 [Trichonephila clavipes]|nr:hypothetical protein TNCV_4695861 [Trichonephila clavipes]